MVIHTDKLVGIAKLFAGLGVRLARRRWYQPLSLVFLVGLTFFLTGILHADPLNTPVQLQYHANGNVIQRANDQPA